MKKIYVAGFVALTALIVAGCSARKKTEPQAEQHQPATEVKTARADTGMVEQLVELTGNIEPFKQNNICPSMGGRIDQILVDVGRRVGRGQLLVRMDQSQYRQSEAQLANLQVEYDRIKTVYDAGGVPKQQLDQIATQLEVAKDAISNLKENVELRSPIDGVVTGRYYDPGDMFTMTPNAAGVTGILTVMQINTLKVTVNVSEQYFPLVRNGMPVDIRVDMFAGETFTGKVSLIYPAIDAKTRTFTVEITIPNGNQKLRPGMFSRVTMNMGSKERVIVPDVAVLKQLGSSEKYVFVLDGDKAVRKTVTTGRMFDGKIELIDGLAGGETVITAGNGKLVDQQQVKAIQ